jgi:hypothetical protein
VWAASCSWPFYTMSGGSFEARSLATVNGSISRTGSSSKTVALTIKGPRTISSPKNGECRDLTSLR